MDIYYWPTWMLVLMRCFSWHKQALVPNFVLFDQECKRIQNSLPTGGSLAYRFARWLILRKVAQEQRAADILRHMAIGMVMVVRE